MASAPVQLVRALAAAAAALEGSADELNRLDGYAGDGDLGITMSEAGRAVKDVLAANTDIETAPLLSACGAAIARKAPSTSGTLVATGFLRAAKAVADDARSGDAGSGDSSSGDAGSGVAALAHAFAAAAAGIQARGKASVGDRTLVDGLEAVCTSLRESLAAGRGLEDSLDLAAQAASVAADKTVGMEPKVGRASWVPQRALGHPDAGCAMLAIALRAAAAGIAIAGTGPTTS